MSAGRPAKHPRSPLGERIYQARIKAGLSQNKLAEILEVSQQFIAQWERKATSINTEALVKLSKALEISADELLGLKEKKEKPGPTGKAELLFKKISKLPRQKRNKILEVVEALLLAQKAS